MKQRWKWIGSIGAIVCVLAGGVYLWQKSDTPGSLRVGLNTRNVERGMTTAKGLHTPWSIVFYGDTPLISSRDTGEVLELDEHGRARIVGKIEDSVHRGEGGLLGLAVHESYVYAYYTTVVDNRISCFLVQGDAGSLRLGDAEVIVNGLPSASYHNGGRIAFGPDGMLYATVGDAGDTESAQDRARLGGKILRMTSDGGVPTDNPFDGSLVYSYGHRNPQGLAWDENGTMYATEFGQNSWDELNVIRAGGNYGWPEVEGMSGCGDDQDCLYIDPVQQWRTRDASPSGMAYTKGMLYIANLRGEVLRVVPTQQVDSSREFFHTTYGRLRDMAIAPDGALWFATNNTDGRGNPTADDDRIISVMLTEDGSIR